MELLLHERQGLADDAGVVAKQEPAKRREQGNQRHEPVSPGRREPDVFDA
ncbi:MAG TPA: hypothetical protein VGF54_11495 [Streptosporangiaceae bacterium]